MILSFLGNVERKGQRWDARYASPVITGIGSTELDFRLAELRRQDETEVVVISGLGSVDLIVPDDLPVIISGLSVVGRRELLGQSSDGILHGTDVASPDYGAATGPRLRLSIFSLVGSVHVRRAPPVGATA